MSLPSLTVLLIFDHLDIIRYNGYVEIARPYQPTNPVLYVATRWLTLRFLLSSSSSNNPLPHDGVLRELRTLVRRQRCLRSSCGPHCRRQRLRCLLLQQRPLEAFPDWHRGRLRRRMHGCHRSGDNSVMVHELLRQHRRRRRSYRGRHHDRRCQRSQRSQRVVYPDISPW